MQGSFHLYWSLLLANIVGLQLLRLGQSSADRRSETDSRVSRAAVALFAKQKTMISVVIFIVLLSHYSQAVHL